MMVWQGRKASKFYVIGNLARRSINAMTQQQKVLVIVLYIIIIILTGLACLNLLFFIALGASSHNVPANTFRAFPLTFIGLVIVDIFAIYQLRNLKKRANRRKEIN
jgi:membrane protein implicated in regulation of membrane protease activity